MCIFLHNTLNPSWNTLSFKKDRDFLGGPVVKNQPFNIFPHVPGQLSLSTTTTELTHCGTHAPRLERSLHAAIKVPHAAAKTRHIQK